MVNCAGRLGVGSVVWLGYNAAHAHSSKPPKPTQINFGANLVALTRAGAASILPAHPRHFDNWLLDVLQQHASGTQPTVRASYVNPAIGAFETHESGCGELSVRTGTGYGTNSKQNGRFRNGRYGFRFGRFDFSIRPCTIVLFPPAGTNCPRCFFKTTKPQES